MKALAHIEELVFRAAHVMMVAERERLVRANFMSQVANVGMWAVSARAVRTSAVRGGGNAER